MRTRRWAWAAGLLAVVVLLGGVAGQLAYVHAETGQWSMSLSSARAPQRIHFQGRDYDQSGLVHLSGDAVRSGTTPGGGAIYLPRGDDTGTPTGLIVSGGDQTWAYALVGGP